ncbi:hypothetical protein M422DRAFT_71920, partial [Sphaerobolus stellatus SS14]
MGPRDESASPPPPPSSSKRSARHPSPHADARSRRSAAHPAAPPADHAPQSPPAHPVSAGRLHYSLPPLPSMNPNYPPHHSPYLPPQPHYPHHLQGPPVAPNAPPLPGMYPYGIPAPYGHHPYGYHQYAHMGPGAFPPPTRPPDVAHPSPQSASQQSDTPPSATKPIKRKRKSEDRAKEEEQSHPELKKRTKTQRACDSCRSRKIRCDVLADADPPVCQHCKQYGFDCTFFLPITETRFKKKRLEEEAAASSSTPTAKPEEGRRTDTPKTDAKGETKIFGPTNVAYLLHSTATVPTRAYESYDLRYHLTVENNKSGDNFIQVHEPPPSESAPPVARNADMRVERDMIERLVNQYFKDLAPIYTVITREEFLASSPPAPLLLYSICSVAAASRDISQTVFENLRSAVSMVIKAEDVLSTTSMVNVQALLILGMCGDCHSQYVPKALSAFWLRSGTAIRMAQDLGLHRAESVKQNLETRRRLWSACVIADRWCSLTYGHPFMIDVEDCDVRLNSSDRIEDMYMNELLKLSILLGRVLKMIYSPSGLVLATDKGLEALLANIDDWNTNLPPPLRFTGPNSSSHAGLLHLFYSCVCMLFWRVFMRISYTVPAHLTFALTVERWSDLVALTRESIDWLDANERVYDVWMMVSYCATGCALVQYHTWARRKDPEAAAALRKLRDCIKRWEATVPSEHRSTRRKTAEIISLLYESTQLPFPGTTSNPASSPGPSSPQHAHQSQKSQPLNPTVGVRLRGGGQLTFKKDDQQPG